MNQNDKDFLRDMMHERMTRHYAEAFDPTGPEATEFATLEQDLNQILDQLPEEQADSVHAYLDYLFNRDADQQELFYRCGLLDGYKLCVYIQNQTGGI